MGGEAPPSDLRIRGPPFPLPCRHALLLAGGLPSGSAAQQPNSRPLQAAAAARGGSTVSGSGSTAPMPAGKKAGAGPSFHHSPSAVHLSALSHILNARDLAEASPKLKPGGGGAVAWKTSALPASGQGCASRSAATLQRGTKLPVSSSPCLQGCPSSLRCPTATASSAASLPPPLVAPGRIFRSGSPAHASLEDVLLLRKQLHVQHMLDFRWARVEAASGRAPVLPCRPPGRRPATMPAVLPAPPSLHAPSSHPMPFPCCLLRSPEEHGEDSAWSLMLSNGLIKTYDQQGNITQVGRQRWQQQRQRHHIASSSGSRQRQQAAC